MRIYIYHILLILVLYSCTPSELTPSEYKQWLSENKELFENTKTVNGINYTVRAQPDVLRQLSGLSKEGFAEDEKQELQYYLLHISADNYNGDMLRYKINNEHEYQARLNYLSFKIENDIELIEGNQTQACRISHYERSYGLAPYLNIVVAFSKTEYNGFKILSFSDEIFNGGRINIKINEVKNLPGLKIK